MPRNFVNATLKESHYYADGTSGSDLNDGLTVGTPKKTKQAVFDIVPYQIANDTAIHLSGNFAEETGRLDKNVLNGKYLVVDGGDTLTQVAGPFTATASGATLLTVSGAGWTVDQYTGYAIEITSGALTGQIRTIIEHTADTMTPVQDFTADPGLCTFRVVRPATTFTNGTQAESLITNCSGGGYLVVQRLYLTGSKARIQCWGSIARTHLVGVIALQGYSAGFSADNVPYMLYYAWPYIVGSGWDYTDVVMGCATLSTAAGPYVTGVGLYYAAGCYFKSATRIKGSGIWGIMYGTRARKMELYSCKDMITVASGGCVQTFAGYATTKLSNSNGVGLLLDDSSFSFGANTVVENSTSHGIEAKNSRLAFIGVTSGSGNGGVGLYAHQGSQVTIAGATPPTVTGTLGDVAVNNPILLTTWANIVSNGGLSSAQEATTVKVS